MMCLSGSASVSEFRTAWVTGPLAFDGREFCITCAAATSTLPSTTGTVAPVASAVHIKLGTNVPDPHVVSGLGRDGRGGYLQSSSASVAFKALDNRHLR